MDLISVIVPVYNAEKYIEECVNSLVTQTYPNMEIILVDDGSKDGSFSVCKKLAEKYKNVTAFHKENGGVASARNYGIHKSSGQYIGFMDNDDYIEPDMFETLISELKKTDAFVAQILVENVTENHETIGTIEHSKSYTEEITASQFKKDLLLQKANMTCWSKLYKRVVLEKYEFVDGRWNEDMLLLYRIFSDPKYNKLISIDKVGYHYVYRSGSYSKNGFNQGYVDNIVNAEWFMQQERDDGIKECAVRLFFHQLIPYYLFIPDTYRNEHMETYNRWIGNVWKKRKIWQRNPYLSIKEKILLTGIMICPKALRDLLEKINYKGYYR